MNREALDRYCEKGILGLVLAALVFAPLALGAVRTFEFAIVEGLTAGVVLLWAARLWLDKRPQFLWPPICWAVLAFVVYAIARYLTADIEYIARQELLRVLVYALLFFAILNNLHRQESTTVISFTLIFLALAISGYAVYQYLGQSDKVWTFVKPPLYAKRGSGTYICPNHLGGFLEMLLPLAMAYTLAGRLKPLPRILVGYAALVMVAGLATSISRGAWVACAAAVLLLLSILMFRRQHRLPAIVLLILLAAGAGVFLRQSLIGRERITELVTDEGKLNDGLRFSLWEPAWTMWRERPWWGVGPAHFDARFPEFRPEGVQATPGWVHNDYLNTLTDWGIAGFALVAAAWVFLVVGVFKTWRSPRLAQADIGGKSTSNKYAFVLGASLGLLAILIHSAVDFNMHIPANALIAITLMALLSAHLRFATESYWARPGLWFKSAATIALLAAVCYIVPQAQRQAREFALLKQARLAQAGPDQIQVLKQAHAVDAMNPQTVTAVGEAYRRQSQEGGQFYEGQENLDYRKLAQEAMRWFKRGMELNPYDSHNWSGYGWCLDWLDRQAESTPYFREAERLNPNNYFNLNYIGLHYVQTGNFAAAKPWFERSRRLNWQDNPIANSYLGIIQTRLLEHATNQMSVRIQGPAGRTGTDTSPGEP